MQIQRVGTEHVGVRGLRIEQHRVQLDGVPIYYEVAGRGGPLVLVHGLSGSGRWWRKNVPFLARSFRVHVVDLIGFGRSRGGQPFVLSEAASCLARWMDRIGLERASVVGHSMGGFIAASLAAEAPERVERLVLVDAAALPFERGYLHHALQLVRAVRYMPLGFVPILVADAWRAGPLTLWSAARELLGTDLCPMLARIRAPTLLVWGEHDKLVPLEIGERLREALPRAELVVVAGAGHNPMWDRAADFNRILGEFLNGGGNG